MKRIIVFLFFLVWFSGVGFGESNVTTTSKSEEIGRPYFWGLKAHWLYTDFVPTKDGKELYTYKNGSIFHWQLIPSIKKLDSFYVGMEDNDTRFGQSDFMYLLEEKQKMILWNTSGIKLVDLKQKKVISDKNISSMAATLTPYGFVTIENIPKTVQVMNGAYSMNIPNRILKVWDIVSLKMINFKEISNPCKNIEKECKNVIWLLNASNQLNILTAYSLTCLDMNSFEENGYNIDNVLTMRSLLSLDKKDLYFDPETYLDLSDCKLKSGKQLVKPHSSAAEKKFFLNNRLFLQFRKISGKDRSYFQLGILSEDNSSSQTIGMFSHDGDDNWMIWKGDRFDTSLPLEQLTMRVKDEKIVPMNETTYKKYYKKINIEEFMHGNY